MRRYGTPWRSWTSPTFSLQSSSRRRENRAVALAFERVFGRDLLQQTRLVSAERRRHSVAVHRARPLDAEDRVMEHRMSLAEIGIQRRQRRQFAADGVVGQRLTGQILAPGDDVGAGHINNRRHPST
jgi:hypothetical protein